jgi:molybdopterin converting factor small subunit
LIVKVKPYGFSKKGIFSLPESGEVHLPEAANLGTLLRLVGVPADLKVVVIVNGRHRPRGYILQPGDDVTFFPPLEGG